MKPFKKSIDFPLFEFDFGASIETIEKVKRQALNNSIGDLVREKAILQKQNQTAVLIRHQNQVTLNRAHQLQQEISQIKARKEKLQKVIQQSYQMLEEQRQGHELRAASTEEEYRLLLQQKLFEFSNKTWTRATELARQIQINHVSLEYEVRQLIEQLEEEDKQFIRLSQQRQRLEVQLLRRSVKERLKIQE